MVEIEGADNETGIVSISVAMAKKEAVAFAAEVRRSCFTGEKTCPECGRTVKVSPVNISRCTNIGGPWKSSIECTNKACRYTELSIKTMHDWRK